MNIDIIYIKIDYTNNKYFKKMSYLTRGLWLHHLFVLLRIDQIRA